MTRDPLLRQVRDKEHHNACMCVHCKTTYHKIRRAVIRKARRALKKLLRKDDES